MSKYKIVLEQYYVCSSAPVNKGSRRYMNILSFVWHTFLSVAQKDFDKVRLILDKRLTYPILSYDEVGYVVKLPLPRRLKSEFYTLFGECYDANESGWSALWRNFKASIYHAALHVAYSDFSIYKDWARGKDIKTATFCVSLIEDLHTTLRAAEVHPAILPDIAYSSYHSALRLNNYALLSDDALRFATLLLLGSWGLERVAGSLARAEKEAVRVAQKIRMVVLEAVKSRDNARLIEGAQLAYSAITRRGFLKQIPSFPYTDSHGETSVFANKMLGESEDLLQSIYRSLGLKVDDLTLDDSRESFHIFKAAESLESKVRERYDKIVSATRFDGLQIPIGDYSMFLRIRAEVAGAIASIKNQLKLINTAEDEVYGDESGHLDLQTAVQVVASRSTRNDVFIRDEKVHKREAWAILLDASRSVKPLAIDVKKIAVCLAEVAKDLLPAYDLWGLFAFNNSFIILKDFNEQYSMEVKARIGGLQQGDATLLPDAVYTCGRALSLLSIEPKILMVVSDGYPVGYRNIERELVYRIHKVLKSGILLLGIGITNPAIRGYFTVNCPLREPYQIMRSFIKSYYELSNLF